MIPRWPDHEQALRELAVADVTAGPGLPVATLLLYDGDDPQLMVRARVEGERDGRDHLSEMATIVAAHQPRRVAWSVPGIARNLTAPRETEPLAHVLACYSVEHRGDGWHHRARMLPYRPEADRLELAPAVDVEVEVSPVGALLDDVVRHPSGHDPLRILAVLTAWGHAVAVPAEGTNGALPPSLRPPSGGDRHRTARLARELSRRHRPTAPLEDARRRPAIVTDVPPGWEAACPI